MEFGIKYDLRVGRLWEPREIGGGSWATHNDNLKFLHMNKELLGTVKNIMVRDSGDWTKYKPSIHYPNTFYSSR